MLITVRQLRRLINETLNVHMPLLAEVNISGLIKKISGQIVAHGGVPYVVGGAVRDSLIPDTPDSKDVDFVVTGLELQKLIRILGNLGKITDDPVGESFSVIKLTMDGFDFDIALPRVSEKKTGSKHTDVDIKTDIYAPIEADLGRRDFTINAIAKSPTGELIDPYGGANDIKNKVIRAVGDPDERIHEDPLRMLRAIQFATRFGFTIHPLTAKAIKANVNLLLTVAKERVLMEFEKAWTKGTVNTHILIQLLKDLGIGRFLFGKEFDPIPLVTTTDNDNKKQLCMFIAFFINGGSSQNMNPTKRMMLYLSLAKLIRDDVPIWEWGDQNHRPKLKFLADLFIQLGMAVKNKSFQRQGEQLKETLKKPIDVNELKLSGGDLREPEFGFVGPAIGKMQRRMLQAVHEDGLKNNKNDLLEFVRKNK